MSKIIGIDQTEAVNQTKLGIPVSLVHGDFPSDLPKPIQFSREVLVADFPSPLRTIEENRRRDAERTLIDLALNNPREV